MKNFFNRATQRIYEAFNGPKVRDTDFEDKIQEMNDSEKGMNSLRSVFLNCDRNINGLRQHFSDVTNSVKYIYSGSSSYSTICNEIANGHAKMEEQLQTFVKSMNDVKKMTDEWVDMFRDAKASITRREELRREYEHYDQKMEEIYNDKSKKQTENQKDIEFYKRNEDKFKDSTENYVNACLVAYEKIDNILSKKFNLINPSIVFLIEREKELFSNITKLLLKFDNLNSKFSSCEKSTAKKIPYDPTKYIRGECLIKKPEFDKEKGAYSYKDWVDKQRHSSVINNDKNTAFNHYPGNITNTAPKNNFESGFTGNVTLNDINNNNSTINKVDDMKKSKIVEVDKSVYNPYEDINKLSLNNNENYLYNNNNNNQSTLINNNQGVYNNNFNQNVNQNYSINSSNLGNQGIYNNNNNNYNHVGATNNTVYPTDFNNNNYSTMRNNTMHNNNFNNNMNVSNNINNRNMSMHNPNLNNNQNPNLYNYNNYPKPNN